MRTSTRGQAVAAGVAAGWLGLAVDYVVAVLLAGQSAVAAVAEWIIRFTPGPVAENVIQKLGHRDKPFLGLMVLLVLTLAFAVTGLLARRSWVAAQLLLTAVVAIGMLAVLTRPAYSMLSVLALLVGYVAAMVAFNRLAAPRSPVVPGGPVAGATSRRGVLEAGTIGAGAVVLGGGGWALGRSARAVESARAGLRIPGITSPPVPAGAAVGIPGVADWQTAASDFYQVDTAFGVPEVQPKDWRLRIHGMVDKEVVLTWDDLLKRPLVQDWITLNCVSNTVGGSLIGNAWWSGYRIADLLKEAGVQAGADAIKQTSHDGWTCGTPIEVVTDDRNAMLAVGLNGAPLPVKHGFPVRMIVPGLYGFVSACKWVTDIEVTQFAKFTAYWTDKGWSEKAPVKLASRIDVPGMGDGKPAGRLRVGGEAWQQHVGIRGVQISLDGGPWTDCEIGRVPSTDSWVQWAATVNVGKGRHELKVRAVSATGEVQTAAIADPAPNGASGLHSVIFTAL